MGSDGLDSDELINRTGKKMIKSDEAINGEDKKVKIETKILT